MQDQFGNYAPGLDSVAPTVPATGGGGGASVLLSEGVPADSTGANGDLAIDTTTDGLCWKSNDTWHP